MLRADGDPKINRDLLGKRVNLRLPSKVRLEVKPPDLEPFCFCSWYVHANHS